MLHIQALSLVFKQVPGKALIVLMDTGGPGNWLDWWSSMLISCKCAARPVPCSLAWQVSAWAQPAGWHTGGTVQAAERNCSASHFLHPTQSASSVKGGFSATSFTPSHAIHTLLHAIKQLSCGLLHSFTFAQAAQVGKKKKTKQTILH